MVCFAMWCYGMRPARGWLNTALGSALLLMPYRQRKRSTVYGGLHVHLHLKHITAY
jgi:hypothetical protein